MERDASSSRRVAACPTVQPPESVTLTARGHQRAPASKSLLPNFDSPQQIWRNAIGSTPSASPAQLSPARSGSSRRRSAAPSPVVHRTASSPPSSRADSSCARAAAAAALQACLCEGGVHVVNAAHVRALDGSMSTIQIPEARALLGLAERQEPDDAAIKRILASCHPDKNKRLDGPEAAVMAMRFRLINQARSLLTAGASHAPPTSCLRQRPAAPALVRKQQRPLPPYRRRQAQHLMLLHSLAWPSPSNQLRRHLAPLVRPTVPRFEGTPLPSSRRWRAGERAWVLAPKDDDLQGPLFWFAVTVVAARGDTIKIAGDTSVHHWRFCEWSAEVSKEDARQELIRRTGGQTDPPRADPGAASTAPPPPTLLLASASVQPAQPGDAAHAGACQRTGSTGSDPGASGTPDSGDSGTPGASDSSDSGDSGH
eukprot:gene11224-16627_t